MSAVFSHGCRFLLQVKHKSEIIESIMLYEALHKRKVFLDAFGEGLEVFGVWSLIRHFPEEMRGALVAPDSISASDVVKIVTLPHAIEDKDERRVWDYFTAFLQSSPESSMYIPEYCC